MTSVILLGQPLPHHSRSRLVLVPATKVQTTHVSNVSKNKSMGWPMAQPTRTRMGKRQSETWMDDPTAMDMERLSLSLTETVTAVMCSTELPAGSACVLTAAKSLIASSRIWRQGRREASWGHTDNRQQDEPDKFSTDIPGSGQAVDGLDEPLRSDACQGSHAQEHGSSKPKLDFGILSIRHHGWILLFGQSSMLGIRLDLGQRLAMPSSLCRED
jgi:hypothetical protein